MHSFASDNNSGVHPDILGALAAANTGHALAYGDDPWTQAAEASFRRVFGEDCQVFFTFLGTGANVLSLASLTRPYHGVVCAETAHINVDECGAPERNLGCKLFALPHDHGRITPERIQPVLHHLGNQHHNQPKVISITQCTELGTLYSLDEIKALADLAHANGMFLHMDGARLCNAAAALGVGFKEMTVDCGVDALSFGGTKNGLMYGEAVVLFPRALAAGAGEAMRFLRKQSMQLASKMRYVAAQFTTLFETGLWLTNARNANAMAALLAREAAAMPGVEITRPVQANAVFARMPSAAIDAVQKRYFFYVWNPEPAERPEVRWMCSFDTTEADVRGFVDALREALAPC
ncbi:threonine aldolase family protein [Fundidesulfovibrio soli]|uniref:threonine aldolase family protein n=1 Tax=Fundidesulfovibrio soli TaxID=2922716 RepID=UPI001FAED33D|nr:beta-eliminating lyase-related protein [Fundidesulfovibrio soli]